MRVLMLSWEYPPRLVGGLGRHVYELSHALAAQGVGVEVVTAGSQTRTPEPEASRLRVYRNPGPELQPLDFITQIHQLNLGLLEAAIPLATESDVIHAHDWLVAFAARTLKHAFRLPLVATIHATEYGRNGGLHNDLQRYIHGAEWMLGYEAGQVVVCSEFMRQEVGRVLTLPGDKVRVVPNGVDPGRLALSPAQRRRLAQFRANLAPAGAQVVLFVGRMVREKGIDVLVEAAPRVLARHPQARFVLVGGPEAGWLAQRAAALGVGDQVRLMGFVPEEDLALYYACAQVAVFPSLYEPFGIVALEAMAAGVPVVVSDAGGLPTVVEHEVTGLTTYAGNAESLAWGICRVLDDPEQARARAAAARRRVRERFTWEQIAKQIAITYRDALTGAGEWRRRHAHESRVDGRRRREPAAAPDLQSPETHGAGGEPADHGAHGQVAGAAGLHRNLRHGALPGG